MSRKVTLIALVVIEAILALLIFRASFSPGFFIALGGSKTPLVAIADILMLTIGVVVGALCRAWQGSIALAMLASVPTAIQEVFMTGARAATNGEIVYLMVPLIVVSLLGWLLRYASAEISA